MSKRRDVASIGSRTTYAQFDKNEFAEIAEMTEQNLSPTDPITKHRAQLPRWAILIAVILATLVLVWLLRTVFAGAWLNMTCGAQKLKCQFDISRLDTGGLTIRNMSITGADPATPPLKAGKVAVDLVWESPWSVRAKAVQTEGVALRLDLREGRPLFGELDGLLKPYTTAKPDTKPGPLPQLDLKTISVIVDTDAGPVEADGQMELKGPKDFTLAIAAKPARIGYQGAELDLKTATLTATSAGQNLNGVIKVDVAMFKSSTARINAMKLDGDFNQTGAGMKAHAVASTDNLEMAEGGLRVANVSADLESEPLDLTVINLEHVLTRIRSLKLDGAAEQGVIAGALWKGGKLAVNVDPTSTNNAEGKLALTVSEVQHVLGKADKLDVAGDLQVARGTAAGKGRALTAVGTARVTGASMAEGPARLLSGAILGALKSSLPDFAEAADKASRNAGSKFDFTAPWQFKVDDAGVDAAALTGMKLQAKSGFAAVFERKGAAEVAAFSQRGSAKWTATGSLRAGGGGLPQIQVDLATASGSGAKFAAAGGAEVKPWKLKSNVLALKASGLDFAMDGAAGHANADVLATYDGLLAGMTLTGSRAQGAVKASWTSDGFGADAPRGLEIRWQGAKSGDLAIGAGTFHYAPTGKLAEKRGSGVGGAGRLEALVLPVTGSGLKATGKIGATAINWTAGATTLVTFAVAPSSFDMVMDKTAYSGALEGVKGSARFDGGWALDASFLGGAGNSDAAAVRGLRGAVKLSGDTKGMNGNMSGLELSVVDPHPAADRMFEDIKATASARLAKGRIDFDGAFNLASSGVSLGAVSGFHDLDKANGEARVARTALVFAPGTFEPSQLSPLLRGPANVAGKVFYQGGMRWGSGKDLRTFADIELGDLGFSLAQAGVFERVSGKVRIDDMAKMTSPPGQTITVGKITLGLPIENGTIKFRLAGTDSINVESASWPFVGGQLRVRPLSFSLETGATNNIVAEAVNWDMNQLVSLFELKDLKLQGHVNGAFPVVFSTGSARINKAELNASNEGGVVQYTGSTGDAAGNADPQARMLFDALKDFRFEVMKVTLDGDIAGTVVLGARLKGRSPAQNNSYFDFGLTLNAPLMSLLNNTTSAAQTSINDIVTSVTTGGRN
jgi:hypothetical protein